MVYFLENNNYSRFQRGSEILRVGERGFNFFQGGGGGGGVQMLISIETYRNCDFPQTPYPLCICTCSAFTCSSDTIIDLHLLYVSELGGTGRSFLLYIQGRGAQWLCGRVLDSRPRSSGFEHQRHHCVVSSSKTH